VFNAAEAVIALTGADKAATLAPVLEGERRVDLYPSQIISRRAASCSGSSTVRRRPS
jgi:hypothetical protein